MKKLGKCQVCGKQLRKKGRTVCFKCRCVQKFIKNGGNTSLTRQGIAIDHLMDKGNLIDKIAKV